MRDGIPSWAYEAYLDEPDHTERDDFNDDVQEEQPGDAERAERRRAELEAARAQQEQTQP